MCACGLRTRENQIGNIQIGFLNVLVDNTMRRGGYSKEINLRSGVEAL